MWTYIQMYGRGRDGHETILYIISYQLQGGFDTDTVIVTAYWVCEDENWGEWVKWVKGVKWGTK